MQDKLATPVTVEDVGWADLGPGEGEDEDEVDVSRMEVLRGAEPPPSSGTSWMKALKDLKDRSQDEDRYPILFSTKFWIFSGLLT